VHSKCPAVLAVRGEYRLGDLEALVGVVELRQSDEFGVQRVPLRWFADDVERSPSNGYPGLDAVDYCGGEHLGSQGEREQIVERSAIGQIYGPGAGSSEILEECGQCPVAFAEVAGGDLARGDHAY